MTAIPLPYLFAPPSRGDGDVRAGGFPVDDAMRREHAAWLEGVRAGDVGCFDALVSAFELPLRRFAERLTDADSAADVVQDVFVWLWERRSTIPASAAARPYLYAATRNRALHLARHAHVETKSAYLFAEHDVPGMGAATALPDALVEHAELAHAVAEALATLSPRVRHVALLRWQDGLRRDEIAAVLEVSPATVKNQLATAIRALRPLVQAFGRSDPEFPTQ